MIVNPTHVLFENTETVSKRGDQMSVLYSLIDDVCNLIFTRKNKNQSRSPRLGSVPVNHL